MAGVRGAADTGRGAVFLAVMRRDAPCRLDLRTGFCLAAARAALRDEVALRRMPAEGFLELVFFKRRRVFSATAFAWNSRSLTPCLGEVPEKISSPRGAVPGFCSLWR